MSAPEDNLVPDSTRTVYSIEMVEQITHLSRERILLYFQHGLVEPVAKDEPAFDEQAIHQLRRLDHLRSEYEMNQEGLRMVANLLREVERLREEVRFLRER